MRRRRRPQTLTSGCYGDYRNTSGPIAVSPPQAPRLPDHVPISPILAPPPQPPQRQSSLTPAATPVIQRSSSAKQDTPSATLIQTHSPTSSTNDSPVSHHQHHIYSTPEYLDHAHSSSNHAHLSDYAASEYGGSMYATSPACSTKHNQSLPPSGCSSPQLDTRTTPGSNGPELIAPTNRKSSSAQNKPPPLPPKIPSTPNHSAYAKQDLDDNLDDGVQQIIQNIPHPGSLTKNDVSTSSPSRPVQMRVKSKPNKAPPSDSREPSTREVLRGHQSQSIAMPPCGPVTSPPPTTPTTDVQTKIRPKLAPKPKIHRRSSPPCMSQAINKTKSSNGPTHAIPNKCTSTLEHKSPDTVSPSLPVKPLPNTPKPVAKQHVIVNSAQNKSHVTTNRAHVNNHASSHTPDHSKPVITCHHSEKPHDVRTTKHGLRSRASNGASSSAYSSASSNVRHHTSSHTSSVHQSPTSHTADRPPSHPATPTDTPTSTPHATPVLKARRIAGSSGNKRRGSTTSKDNQIQIEDSNSTKQQQIQIEARNKEKIAKERAGKRDDLGDEVSDIVSPVLHRKPRTTRARASINNDVKPGTPFTAVTASLLGPTGKFRIVRNDNDHQHHHDAEPGTSREDCNRADVGEEEEEHKYMGSNPKKENNSSISSTHHHPTPPPRRRSSSTTTTAAATTHRPAHHDARPALITKVKGAQRDNHVIDHCHPELLEITDDEEEEEEDNEEQDGGEEQRIDEEEDEEEDVPDEGDSGSYSAYDTEVTAEMVRRLDLNQPGQPVNGTTKGPTKGPTKHSTTTDSTTTDSTTTLTTSATAAVELLQSYTRNRTTTLRDTSNHRGRLLWCIFFEIHLNYFLIYFNTVEYIKMVVIWCV